MRYALISALCLLLSSCGGGDVKEAQGGSSGLPKPETGVKGAWLKDVLSSYYGVKQSLVDDDAARADSMATLLMAACDSVAFPATVYDSSTASTIRNLLGDISAECMGFRGEATMESKRRSFNMMGEFLYPLLQSSGYDGSQVYRQVCPMAFNDSEKAGWLSDSREILNPYLGKKHPKYGAGMLHCGELEDSLSRAR
jgi:hypothetical protein